MANVTDINDKIYDGGAGRRRAVGGAGGRDDRPLHRRHRAAGAGAAGPRAAGLRVRRADRGADRRPGRARARLRGRRRRLLPRPLAAGLRRAVAPHDRPDGPGRGRRGRRPQGGSAGFRALEGREGGRGHLLALALGPRAARLAHRVLGDGRGAAGRRARHPRRRRRPALPAPRERGGADARRAREAAGAAVDAQRDAPAGGREDVEVRGQHPRARRGARRGRPRRAAHVLRRRPLPPADRLHARAPRRRRGERAAHPRCRPPPAAR